MYRILATSLFVLASFNIDGKPLQQPATDFEKVAIAAWHVCFLSPDELRCGGNNQYKRAPRKVPFKNAKLVAVNDDHTCVADEENVWCYGRSEKITRVPTGLRNVTSLTLGLGYACALANNEVRCWGERDGVPPISKRSGKILKIQARERKFCRLFSDALVCHRRGAHPAETTDALDGFPVDVAIGHQHSCVLQRSIGNKQNTVRCFGANDKGQVVVPPLDRPDMLAAGWKTSCARTYTGFQCWGEVEKHFPNTDTLVINHSSVCGIRQGTPFCTGEFADQVSRELSNPENIYLAGNLSCARDSGEIICWGDSWSNVKPDPRVQSPGFGVGHYCWLNDNQVACSGAAESNRTFPPPLKNPRYVSVGRSVSCAIDDTGIVCWGRETHRSPHRTREIDNPLLVAANNDRICAVNSSLLRCWSIYRTITKEIPVSNPKTLISGHYHFCLLDDNGLNCWEPSGREEPNTENVPPMSDIKSVCAGGHFSCAIHDEQVSCWGRDADVTTQIPVMDQPREIACGFHHACALDGKKVICWGENEYGQSSPPQ